MDHQDLINRIEAALARDCLSAWQRSFLTDLRAKIEHYGSRTRLSDKQLRKLHEIIGTDRNVVPFPTQKPSRSGRSWRPRRRQFFEREVRWWTRRFVRDFAFAVALFAVILAFSLSEKIPVSWPITVPSLSNGAKFDEPFTVTDGDTIRLSDGTPVRLVGFNTPEVFSPKCRQERELGNRASARLEELVATSKLELSKIPCSCPPNTEGTDACNHSRSCGILKADGRDVGQILISEGLAVEFKCGATGCPPTPRPWCG